MTNFWAIAKILILLATFWREAVQLQTHFAFIPEPLGVLIHYAASGAVAIAIAIDIWRAREESML